MATLSEYFYTGPRITLNSGRVINMQTIYQGLAYSYVLEGIPYGPDYQRTVNLHLKWAQDRYPDRRIVVLEPRLRPLGIAEVELQRLRTLSQSKESDVPGRAGINYPEPVSIGSVCCRALFESKPINGDVYMLSQLMVLWFQDGFAMPIDPQVIEQIQALDWDAVAEDVDL